ncbi:hypothetical protein ACFX13_030007 [Malus domestica]
MSYCQTRDEMVDAVPEVGQQHSWAEKGEVGDGVEPVPVAEVVTETGVEKGDGAAVEDGPGYVAEFGAADTEALAPVENEAVTEMELGNMAVSAHELLGKSALSGGVAAVGWLVPDFEFEPQQEPGHLEAEFGVELELEKFGAVAEVEFGAVAEVEFEAEVASMSEVDSGRSHMVAEPAVVVELLAVDRDSSSDIAVDMGHIQDTAGSTVDIVAAAGTIDQQSAQPLELENLSLLSDLDQIQVQWHL